MCFLYFWFSSKQRSKPQSPLNRSSQRKWQTNLTRVRFNTALFQKTAEHIKSFDSKGSSLLWAVQVSPPVERVHHCDSLMVLGRLWVNKFFWPSVRRIRDKSKQQENLQEKEKNPHSKTTVQILSCLVDSKCKDFPFWNIPKQQQTHTSLRMETISR